MCNSKSNGRGNDHQRGNRERMSPNYFSPDIYQRREDELGTA